MSPSRKAPATDAARVEQQAEQIRGLIRESTGKRAPNVQPWPGCPVGHIPLMFKAALDAMIATGEVEVVTRPSLVNPRRAAAFVRFANGEA